MSARGSIAFLGDDDLWRFAPCLTHGDIGPEHVLVSPSGDLVGVLDWEELSVGDPVADFAWLLHARPADGERALGGIRRAARSDVPRGAARSAIALMPFHEVEYGLGREQTAFVDERARGHPRNGPTWFPSERCRPAGLR